jgi:signal transduction histidine kinase
MMVKRTSRVKEQTLDRRGLFLGFTECSPLAMVAVEGLGHIVCHVNPAFCRLVGKTREELIGYPFGKAVPKGRGCISVLDRVYRTGESETCDDQGDAESGWSYAVWPVLAPDERPMGLMLQVEDMGEAELFREQAATMNQELMLSALRQHELTEAAEKLSTGLEADLIEREKLEEKLRKSSDELEIRVQERTEELRTVNEELRAENEERLKVEIDLRESETRLRQLSAELLNAQEKERKLVAQEIHDSIGSSLAAAKFKIEAVFEQVADKRTIKVAALEGIIPILQEAIDESRRIQMALRPSILDDFGIVATLNWFCRQFESTYSHICIKKEIDVQEHQIHDSLKTVIYRVSQEAFNNIAKHSKANTVSVSLLSTERAVTLAIQDNGKGFNAADAHSRPGTNRGLGLDSMRERVELSGGSYSLESNKGAGTVIRASWPLQNIG